MPQKPEKINPTADFGPGHPFTGTDIISAYTRAQAIADGVLVDVTPIAYEIGWRYPVAVTHGVWMAVIDYHLDDRKNGADPALRWNERLRELLHLAATWVALAEEKAGDVIHFAMTRSDRATRELWAKCGPGDHAEPVVTIMLIGED